MKKNQRGVALMAVIAIMVVVMILLPALILWMQQDMKMSVKQMKSTTAYNLAEAGIDRGMWELKSSTSTCAQACAGVVLNGYNFDTTYSDIPGGSYRIKFSSGPSTNQVTIWAEGRDNARKEVRSLKEVVQNQTIYSALMAGGNIGWAKGLCVYWGPIMSQGNLTLVDDSVAAWYFPRKYAKGTVIGTALHPRDTNGLTPPNTDNTEWWSEYDGVPNVPVLDFATLKSSAIASGTYNLYGCKGNGAAWDNRSSCATGIPHTNHFGNQSAYITWAGLDPNKDYVWYWDNDVTFTGDWCTSGVTARPGSLPCNQSYKMRGTIIVRGNLTIDTPGDFDYTGPVPPNAWQEENRLTSASGAGGDTNASAEYPADNGFHSNSATFHFGYPGGTVWNQAIVGGNWRATVGVKGFSYVGGNLNILSFMDFNGAVWVNGTVTATNASNSNFCTIFFDNNLVVPALNVILVRISWNEVTPSSTVWN